MKLDWKLTLAIVIAVLIFGALVWFLLKRKPTAATPKG